jgi:competence protein ComEA
MKKLFAALALVSFALLSPVKAFSAEPGLIEINKATMEDLVKVKGIGKKKAQKILELKKELGTITAMEQLRKVKGIGKKTIGTLACTLYAEKEGKLPCVQTAPAAAAPEKVLTEAEKININTATMADLDKVKGIGKKMAQKIMDYRTTNGKFATMDDLLKVRGIGKKSLENFKKYMKAE